VLNDISLTGWNIDDIRKKMGLDHLHDGSDFPWWKKLRRN